MQPTDNTHSGDEFGKAESPNDSIAGYFGVPGETYDSSEHQLDASQPLVLLLGWLDNAGIVSVLKTAGRQYKIKHLNSSPENWRSVVAYFEQFEIRCVLLKLTGPLYDLLVAHQYQKVRELLFEYLTQVPHAILIQEDLYKGHSHQSPDLPLDSDFYQPAADVRNKVNDLLANHRLNLLLYKTNAELTVMASAFVAETEQGLIFRFYVPAGRIWANEIDKLLQLFRDHLTRVGQLSVRLDQHRTQHGVVYEFFTTASIEKAGGVETILSTQFQEFSHLLDLSLSDPAKAEAILKSKQVNPREIVPILTRYAKEAKRLQIDMKQEREQKMLAVRHRLESELADALPADVAWQETVDQLVNIAIPALTGIGSALGSGQQLLQLNATGGSSISVNVSPQTVNSLNAVVAQEIQGDVHLTNEDHQMLQLIREYAPDREAELASAVRELADPTAPPSGRLLAKQRLKAFLIQVGGKLGDISLSLLQGYLEKKFGLS